MKILFSFIGSNDAGKLDQKEDGAILNLLSQFSVDKIVLLFNTNGRTKNNTTYESIATHLKNEIIRRKYCNKEEVIIKEINFQDITDHREIYKYLLNYLNSEFLDTSEFEYYAAISSGTPAMQTAWILIAESAQFPLNLLKTIEKKHSVDRNLVKKIELITGIKEYIIANEKKYKSSNKSHFLEIEYPTELNEFQKQIAVSKHHILIYGETGTGKEVLAGTIHKESERNGKFIPLNCAGLSEALLESELFGHKKGAFTGADRDKKGIVEEHSDGTLFLDEINSLPIQLQAKLLRFLDSGEYRAVGSNEVKKSKIRVIAATNELLYQKVQDKEFRSDLYYRLMTIQFKIKPLRERKENLKTLITTINPSIKFSEDGLLELENYDFPGNVRELKIILDRLSLMSKGNQISVGDVKEVLNGVMLESKYAEISIPKELYGKAYKFVRNVLLNETLRITDNNKSQAAKILGISHPTISNWEKEKDD